MSNQPIKHSTSPRKRVLAWVIGFMTVLIGAGLLPPSSHGEETNTGLASPLPLLVRARRGDTPASIAQRYLDDASKGWMIVEYNGIETLSGGDVLLIPVAPFRPGGLTPDGYQTVPVLAYADIGNASAFNHQMRGLKTAGFTAITPAQLIDFMEFSSQLPRRSVLITFDTVSQPLYDIGIPILNEYGFTATVFVATDHIGGKGAMTWDQIKQLNEDGFTIACRGRSGRSLTRRTKGQAFEAHFQSVESELHLARKAIEKHLDAPCLFLAYPHGSTNRLVSAMAAKLGFSAAFVLGPGENPFFADRFGIHRIVVDSHINPERFGNILNTLITADLN